MSKPSIIRPASRSANRGINFLLYGDPGSGKTPFLATGERTLIIDMDGGAESAVNSKAEIWEAEDWPTLDEVYEYLRHDPNHGYKWVWLDGVSIGQEKLLEGIMVDLIVNQNKRHRKVWAADQGEYQQNMVRIKQWVRHMSALDFNFGITAHPFRWADPVTEITRMWPWIQGKNMPNTVCGYMNIIGYMKVGNDQKHRLYTRLTEDFYARDRFGALGAGLINPSIPMIERKVKEATRPNLKVVRSTTTRKAKA